MTPRLFSAHCYYTAAKFSHLTGIPKPIIRYRYEHGIYRMRRRHEPGQHWEIMAAKLRAELRKRGGR